MESPEILETDTQEAVETHNMGDLKTILEASITKAREANNGGGESKTEDKPATTQEEVVDGSAKVKPPKQETTENPVVGTTPVIPEGYIPSTEAEAIRKELDSHKSKLSAYEADPYLKELLGIRDKGGAITKELLKEAFEDFDAYDVSKIQVAYDLLKRSLLEQGLSEKEANLQLKHDYAPLIGDDVDEQSDAYQLAEAKISRLASQYVNQKKENQLKLKSIPTPSTNKEDVVRELQAKSIEDYNLRKQKLSEAANEVFTTRKTAEIGFTFKNEKNEPIEASISADITAEIKKDLVAAMSNPVIMDAVAQFVDFKQPSDKVEAEIIDRLLLICKPKLYASLIANEAAAHGASGVLGTIKPKPKHDKYGNGAGVDKSQFDLTTPLGQLEYNAAVAKAKRTTG